MSKKAAVTGTPTTFTIELPQVITVRDYHDFAYLQTAYREIGLKNIKIDEIAMFNAQYHGILHLEKDAAYKLMKKTLEANAEENT